MINIHKDSYLGNFFFPIDYISNVLEGMLIHFFKLCLVLGKCNGNKIERKSPKKKI